MTLGPLTGIVAAATGSPPPVVPRLRSALEPVDARFDDELAMRDAGTWSELYARPADVDEFAGVALLLRSFGIDTLPLGTSPAGGEAESPPDVEPERLAAAPDARRQSSAEPAPVVQWPVTDARAAGDTRHAARPSAATSASHTDNQGAVSTAGLESSAPSAPRPISRPERPLGSTAASLPEETTHDVAQSAVTREFHPSSSRTDDAASHEGVTEPAVARPPTIAAAAPAASSAPNPALIPSSQSEYLLEAASQSATTGDIDDGSVVEPAVSPLAITAARGAHASSIPPSPARSSSRSDDVVESAAPSEPGEASRGIGATQAATVFESAAVRPTTIDAPAASTPPSTTRPISRPEHILESAAESDSGETALDIGSAPHAGAFEAVAVRPAKTTTPAATGSSMPPSGSRPLSPPEDVFEPARSSESEGPVPYVGAPTSASAARPYVPSEVGAQSATPSGSVETALDRGDAPQATKPASTASSMPPSTLPQLSRPEYVLERVAPSEAEETAHHTGAPPDASLVESGTARPAMTALPAASAISTSPSAARPLPSQHHVRSATPSESEETSLDLGATSHADVIEAAVARPATTVAPASTGASMPPSVARPFSPSEQHLEAAAFSAPEETTVDTGAQPHARVVGPGVDRIATSIGPAATTAPTQPSATRSFSRLEHDVRSVAASGPVETALDSEALSQESNVERALARAATSASSSEDELVPAVPSASEEMALATGAQSHPSIVKAVGTRPATGVAHVAPASSIPPSARPSSPSEHDAQSAAPAEPAETALAVGAQPYTSIVDPAGAPPATAVRPAAPAVSISPSTTRPFSPSEHDRKAIVPFGPVETALDSEAQSQESNVERGSSRVATSASRSEHNLHSAVVTRPATDVAHMAPTSSIPPSAPRPSSPTEHDAQSAAPSEPPKTALDFEAQPYTSIVDSAEARPQTTVAAASPSSTPPAAPRPSARSEQAAASASPTGSETAPSIGVPSHVRVRPEQRVAVSEASGDAGRESAIADRLAVHEIAANVIATARVEPITLLDSRGSDDRVLDADEHVRHAEEQARPADEHVDRLAPAPVVERLAAPLIEAVGPTTVRARAAVTPAPTLPDATALVPSATPITHGSDPIRSATDENAGTERTDAASVADAVRPTGSAAIAVSTAHVRPRSEPPLVSAAMAESDEPRHAGRSARTESTARPEARPHAEAQTRFEGLTAHETTSRSEAPSRFEASPRSAAPTARPWSARDATLHDVVAHVPTEHHAISTPNTLSTPSTSSPGTDPAGADVATVDPAPQTLGATGTGKLIWREADERAHQTHASIDESAEPRALLKESRGPEIEAADRDGARILAAADAAPSGSAVVEHRVPPARSTVVQLLAVGDVMSADTLAGHREASAPHVERAGPAAMPSRDVPQITPAHAEWSDSTAAHSSIDSEWDAATRTHALGARRESTMSGDLGADESTSANDAEAVDTSGRSTFTHDSSVPDVVLARPDLRRDIAVTTPSVSHDAHDAAPGAIEVTTKPRAIALRTNAVDVEPFARASAAQPLAIPSAIEQLAGGDAVQSPPAIEPELHPVEPPVTERTFDAVVTAAPRDVAAYRTPSVVPARPAPGADASRAAAPRQDASARERTIRIVIDRIEIGAPPAPPPRAPAPPLRRSMSLEDYLGSRR